MDCICSSFLLAQAELFSTATNRRYTPSMIEVPMTDDQFAVATRRLQQNGIELTGTAGTLTKDGITASYEHTMGLLRIVILKKPMLLPESLIEGRLKAYLEQSLVSS